MCSMHRVLCVLCMLNVQLVCLIRFTACRRAKAKRERLRQAHLAPDYLPLGGASKLLGVPAAAGSGEAAAGRQYAGSESEGEGDEEGGEGLAGAREQGLGGRGSDSETELEERMRLTFVGQQQQGAAGARGRGASGKGGSSRGAAAAAMASGQYATTVQDEEMQDEDADQQYVSQQQRLAAAIKRNAAGGSRLAGAAGGARGEAAIGAAAAGVLEALQEATGRATARHKQLSANLKRTDDNLVGALEEAERIRVRNQAAFCIL